MFCPKCGSEIDGSPKFCPKCGAPLSEEAAPQQPAGQPQAPAPAPASSGGSAVSVIEKILAVCFIAFFAIRALVELATLFSIGRYSYYYRTGFGTMIAFICLLLVLAGTLLMALTIFGYGFLGREDQKKDLLLLVAAAVVIRFVITLFSFVLPPYLMNRWLDFVMGLAAVIIFFALRYVQDTELPGRFKGQSLGTQLGAGLAVYTQGQSKETKAAPGAATPAQNTVPGTGAAAQTAAQGTYYANNTAGYAGAPQQPVAPPPVGTNPLPTDRSLAFYIIISFITCGIYGYYFLYTLARDANIACAGDGDNTPGLAELILLSIITCGIYAYYWDYKIGNRLAANAPRYGLRFEENGTTVLMWDIIGIFIFGIGHYIAMYILIKNMNALSTEYNKHIVPQAPPQY